MATADGLVLSAGALSFASNWHKESGFPSNGYATIGATVALVFLASTTRGSVLEGPVKGLAGLMLLAAVYQSIPAFTKKKRVVNNG